MIIWKFLNKTNFKTEKGVATVILDVENYIEKTSKKLKNENFSYETQPPLSKITQKLN